MGCWTAGAGVEVRDGSREAAREAERRSRGAVMVMELKAASRASPEPEEAQNRM